MLPTGELLVVIEFRTYLLLERRQITDNRKLAMERWICSSCGARQPAGSRGADLCSACGKPVRTEKLCPWCGSYSPEGTYCRQCGCELPEPRLFGAARMLKDAGVDRFALGARLRDMDPELLATLQRRYDEQRAIVELRVAEARFCERHLLLKGFADELEERLIRLIPVGEKEIADLASGVKGPFNDARRLEAIFESSPLPDTRVLAALAMIRTGCRRRDIWKKAADCLIENSRVAQEAAMALALWRTYDCFGRTDPRLFAGLAEPLLSDPDVRLYAAIACARLWLESPRSSPDDASGQRTDRLRTLLREGLESDDRDLQFTCALLLGDESALVVALDGEDTRDEAMTALAGRGAALSAVFECVRNNPEKLMHLIDRTPLPPANRDLELILEEARRLGPDGALRICHHLCRLPFAGYGADARIIVARWMEQYGLELLSAADLLEILHWATRPMGDDSPAGDDLPVFSDGRRAFHCVVSEKLLHTGPHEREKLPAQTGTDAWLWGATDALAQRALDAWVSAGTDDSAVRLFERMSALDSFIKADGGHRLQSGQQILFSIWDRADAVTRGVIARHVAAGWSWGYRQDTAGALEQVRKRYVEIEDQRPFLRVAFRRLLNHDGTNWQAEHESLLPGVPSGGTDPERTFRILCELEPDDTYEHVLTVLNGITPVKAAPIARLLFARQQAVGGEPTRLLPPIVAYARFLDQVAEAWAGKQDLGDCLGAFSDGWIKIQALLPSPDDPQAPYYVQEKREEIAGIVARVESIVGGMHPG